MGIINIFKRETQQLNSGIDVWVVKWTCFEAGYHNALPTPRYQAFTNKDEAVEFADSIRRAHDLIGNIGYIYTRVTITKQQSRL